MTAGTTMNRLTGIVHPMTPHDFVHKWRTLIASPGFSEIGYYQPHSTDLCALVGHPAPTDTDIDNQPFIFEKQVTKEQGGKGRADVWYKGRFAIEYKQPGADLDAAYKQLLQYRESLQNPPLLIVGDFRRLVIHTNFTNAVNYAVTLTLDDLQTVQGLQQLRNVFFNVEAFRPQTTTAQVTEEAAAIFGRLASHLGKWGHDPQAVAHYLIRLFFCLFAEDIGLLPQDLFTRLVAQGKRDPKAYNAKIRQLFHAMAEGSTFGEHDIRYFNGGLFDDDAIVEMDAEALGILDRVSTLDWSAIEPAILGTLFTRSLDPSKRAQLGAHYTSREDILLIVEPVLMAPLRREWAEIQGRLVDLAARKSAAPSRAAATNLAKEMNNLIAAFVDKLRATQVSDLAMGAPRGAV